MHSDLERQLLRNSLIGAAISGLAMAGVITILVDPSKIIPVLVLGLAAEFLLFALAWVFKMI